MTPASYHAAVEEAPAMVFLLTEAWCRSEWCEQELFWFLATRTGADLAEQTPAQVGGKDTPLYRSGT